MSDFDAQLPVRALPTEFATEVANSGGTIIDPAEEFAQGSTTSGQSGPLTQGAVTTAAPSYTDGQTDPLSLTPAGALRTDSSATTQPVSGTVTANQGTPNSVGNSWPVEVTDGTNVLGTPTHPVRTDPTGTTTQPVSGTVTANQGGAPWSINETQIDGTAVSVNTGNADAGTQRVVLASDQPAVAVTFTQPTPTLTYNTDAAVASGATVTHSLAGPVVLDEINAAGSGEIKLIVAIGTTGSEATVWTGFSSSAEQICRFKLPNSYSIPGGQSVKLTIKNRDTAAQDVYSTIFSH